MSALAIQVKDLTTSLQIVKEEAAAKDETLAALQAETDTLKASAEAFDSEKAELQTKIEAAAAELEAEKAKAQAAADESVKAKAELEEARAEVTKLTEALASGIPPPVGEGEGIPTGTAEQNPTLTKAEFKALSPSAQNHFYRNGGKLTD